jgi:hypothetical protein
VASTKIPPRSGSRKDSASSSKTGTCCVDTLLLVRAQPHRRVHLRAGCRL